MHNSVFAQRLRVLGALAEAYRPRCHDVPKDDRVWQHDADYTIRWLYLMASFIGLGIWVVLNPVSLLCRSLFRRQG